MAEGGASIRSHKDLQVWRRAMELARAIYRTTEGFPKKEEYRLTSQMIRAAISIPANIAEGNARSTRKDYAHFVSIARGSGQSSKRFCGWPKVWIMSHRRCCRRLSGKQKKWVICSMDCERS